MERHSTPCMKQAEVALQPKQKSLILWVVNVLSFVLVSLLALTGLTNWLVFAGGGHPQSGMAGTFRHFLREVHEWTGVFFLLVLGVHLALHWNYIRANLKKYNFFK
jgi:hypothetical protein